MKGKSTKHCEITKTELFFVSLFLFGLYTTASYYINDRLFVPFFICGLTLPYFLFKNWQLIRKFPVKPLLAIYVITSIGIILSPLDDKSNQWKGLLYLIYSTSLASIFFINIRRWRPEAISKLFFVSILFISVGSILEVAHTPVKVLSDGFRKFGFYQYVYEDEVRDIIFHGYIRPNLFTPEPSYVGVFSLLALFVWFAVSNMEIKRRTLLYTVFVLINLLILRTPIILLAVPLGILILLASRHITIIQGTFLGILLSALSIIVAVTVFPERLNQIISGRDVSFNYRVLGAAQIMIETLKEYPTFGTGVSGREIILDKMVQIYQDYGWRGVEKENYPANALCIFISQYGLVGSSLFILSFISFIRSLRIKNALFILVAVLIFSQTYGGFIDVRTWSYIFIIMLVAYHLSKIQAQQSGIQLD
jgi:hypothetical protein